MASSPRLGLGRFATQTYALTKKNLLIAVKYHPIATFVRAILLPLAFTILILETPNYSSPRLGYGVGPPVAVASLADSLRGTYRDLVLVQPPGLGADVQAVVDRLVERADGLAGFPHLVRIASEAELLSRCPSSLVGASTCHAAVVFYDSPGTVGGKGRWNYSVRADYASAGGAANVFSRDGGLDTVWLPLQVAVDNAITGADVKVETQAYTHDSQADVDKRREKSYQDLVYGVYRLVLFIGFTSTIYHVVGAVARERESGMSRLVDVMGGSPAARVLSQVIAFDIMYLPTWMAFGVCYWALLFRSHNFAIFFFWQILNGWAVTSAAVFAASVFRKSQMAGIYVVAGFVGVAVGALAYDSDRVRPEQFGYRNPTTPGVTLLTLLFPSANFVYQLGLMCLFATRGATVTLAAVVPQPDDVGQMPYTITLAELWAFLAVQIVVYPLLALPLERALHGISFRGRSFGGGGARGGRSEKSDDDDPSTVAVRTSGLRKVYGPSRWRQVFCCGRGGPAAVVAVDSLDLTAQKRQVLCLLGANGSGKTTTLDLVAGLQRSTGGSVAINAAATQLGVCPQKNTLWDELTVQEHVNIWEGIKGHAGNKADVADLIEACDLTIKARAGAGTLSGGQKRKLQLACMFSGGSTVCLMDEPTSGLDPLSRRIIWNIVLAERSKRSMILTTHFLDECEVLADHIVIVSKGHLKCEGPAAELKELYGGGYRVYLPRSAGALLPADTPRTTHQDQYIYVVGDSAAAANVLRTLEEKGQRDVFVAGPTIENVFLNVAKEDDPLAGDDVVAPDADADDDSEELSSGTTATFWRQTWVLMRKRLTVLRRNWWPYFFALALPIAVTPALSILLKNYVTQGCLTTEQQAENTRLDNTYSQELFSWSPVDMWDGATRNFMVTGPPSINASVFHVLSNFSIGLGPFYDPNATAVDDSLPYYYSPYSNRPAFNTSLYNDDVVFESTRAAFQKRIFDNIPSVRLGGLFMDGDGTSPLVVFDAGYGNSAVQTLLNLATQARSGVEIVYGTGDFGVGTEASDFGSFQYAAYFCLIQAIWPALFCLYPTYERLRKVRAVQYSNGVRPLPLWTAHTLFDFCFIFVSAGVVTIFSAAQLNYWYVQRFNLDGSITLLQSHWFAIGYMFPVLLLYGLASTLVGYVFSAFAPSQLSAYAFTVAFGGLSFLVSLLAFSLENIFVNPTYLQQALDTTTWTLNLILPVGNVLRAINVGLNSYAINCRNNQLVGYAGSIYAYGGPILYLLIQCVLLFGLVYWLDRKHALRLLPAAKAKFAAHKLPDSEEALEKKTTTHQRRRREDVARETARVEGAHNDLLRLLHVTKAFGDNVAVDDVSLGLGDGEILALLGPNGAGKTTMVNMIQGELHPDNGNVYVQGIDVSRHTRKAQKHLGVCPQFDALDLMTARQHLEFYARAKGVSDVERNVSLVMRKVGLTSFGSRPASKLSGGNKRKLSLAIALMGNPGVLILDEPSSSMDAVAKRAMWRVLAAIAPGRSVLLTTHSMEEADALATRAAILARGLLAVGTTSELRLRYENVYHVQLVLRSAPASSAQELAHVERWVQTAFPDAAFEGENLGGQVKFTVPAFPAGGSRSGVAVCDDKAKAGFVESVSAVSSPPTPPSGTDNGSGPYGYQESRVDEVHEDDGRAGSGRGERSVGLRLIETLEASKEALGLQTYSIGAATLERVFLGVVKENNVLEEDEGLGRKKGWWRWW